MDDNNAVSISPIVLHVNVWGFSNDRVCMRTKGNESSIRRIPICRRVAGTVRAILKLRKKVTTLLSTEAAHSICQIKCEDAVLHTYFNPSKGNTNKCH